MILAVAAAALAGVVGSPAVPRSVDAACTTVDVPVAPGVLRPTSGGTYRYETADVRMFVGESAVVHYVTTGPDAPPVEDVDGDHVPDFVEKAGRAADGALRFFAAPTFGGTALHAFAPPPCDRGGPDSRPDIYVKDISGYGVAFGPVVAEGGSFVLIDPALEGDAQEVTGGVEFSVAHELFHLVQFAYDPRGFPPWIAEGTANLFAFLWQRIDQPVLLASLDRWYSMTYRSIVEVGGCDRCYGGILWWAMTVVDGRPILARCFELLREHWLRGEPVGDGLDALTKAVSDFYAQVGLGPIAAEAFFYEFEAVGEAMYFVLAPKRPPILYGISPRFRSISTGRTLETLATHYIRLSFRPGTRAVRIRITGRATRPRFSVFLGVEGRRCRRAIGPRFRPRSFVLEDVVVFPVDAARDRNNVLMVTGGTLAGGTYRIESRAYRSPQVPVGSQRTTCGVP